MTTLLLTKVRLVDFSDKLVSQIIVQSMVRTVPLAYSFLILIVSADNNDKQINSLVQFCTTNRDDTIEPKLEPILCPDYFKARPEIHGHFCPRLLNANLSNQLKSSLYLSTKLYWKKLFHKFKIHLRNQTVYFLGDSIRGQMMSQMRCLEDFTDIKLMNHIHESKLYGFPTQLNSHLYNFSKHTDVNVVDRAFRQEWYYHILHTRSIKYLVLNTGMWWNPDYFIYINNNSLVHNDNDMLDIYRLYFHREGLFLSRIYDLMHNYNVTVLWRDTSPAGSCTLHDRFERYHSLLSTMNIIAQTALRQIGVVIISGIWEESLPYWKLHMEMGSQGYMDLVHYCGFQNQSLMNLWINKTIHVILEN